MRFAQIMQRKRRWTKTVGTLVAVLSASSLLVAGGAAPASAAPGVRYSDDAAGGSAADAAVGLRHCGFDPGTGVPQVVPSTLNWVGMTLPESTRNVRVGEEFRIFVVSYHVTRDCHPGVVRPILVLPAGVQVATSVSRPVTCLNYAQANPSNKIDRSGESTCRQTFSSPTLNLSPVGAAANQGWGMDATLNAFETSVLVRATTTGVKTLTGRICDLPSQESGAACVGTNPSNIGSNNNNVNLSFTVDPSSGGTTSPPPSGTEPSAPATVDYPQRLVVNTQPLELSVEYNVHAPGAGVARSEMRHPGQASAFSTSQTNIPGPGDWIATARFAPSEMMPFTYYQVRGCYVRAGFPDQCAPWRNVFTGVGTVDVRSALRVSTEAAEPIMVCSDGECRVVAWIKKVQFWGSVTSAARSAGSLYAEWHVSGGSNNKTYLFDSMSAMRTQSTMSSGMDKKVAVPTTVTYRVCFMPSATDVVAAGAIPPYIPPRCTAWQSQDVNR